MSSIMEMIFTAILTAIANLCSLMVSACMEVIEYVGLDTSTMTSLFPAFDTIYSYMSLIAGCFVIILFVAGLFQMMTTRLTGEDNLPANNAFQLVGRLVVSCLLIGFFKPFFEDVIISKCLIPLFTEFAALVNSGLVEWSVEDVLVSYFNELLADLAAFIIIIFFFIYLCILLFKFLFFHIEKFFTLFLFTYCSPLAAATYVNKKTASVWKNYVSILAVNVVTLLFNVIIIIFIKSGLLSLFTWRAGNVSIVDAGTTEPWNVVIGLMFICAVAKVGKKMSVYISQLFNMNGMTDQVRAGLGEAAGAVMAGAMMASRGKGVYDKFKHGGKDGKNGSNGDMKRKAADTDKGFGISAGTYFDSPIGGEKRNDPMSKESDLKATDISSVGGNENEENGKKRKVTDASNFNNPYKNKDQENKKGIETDSVKTTPNVDEQNAEDKDKTQNKAVETDKAHINMSDKDNTDKNQKHNGVDTENLKVNNDFGSDNNDINKSVAHGADTEKVNIRSDENSKNSASETNTVNQHNHSEKIKDKNNGRNKNMEDSSDVAKNTKSVSGRETANIESSSNKKQNETHVADRQNVSSRSGTYTKSAERQTFENPKYSGSLGHSNIANSETHTTTNDRRTTAKTGSYGNNKRNNRKFEKINPKDTDMSN